MNPHPVLGVLSGCGGAGASTLAALLAWVLPPPTVLIDCDPLSGGIDVLLGCEQVRGPRWSQVRLRGGGLDAATLLQVLPRWHEVRFLAADGPARVEPAAISAMADAAAQSVPVVLDLPRSASEIRAAGMAVCDAVAVVTPAEVRGVTATAVLIPGLDPARSGIVVRGSSRSLPAGHIGQLLGLPVWAQLRYDPAIAAEDGLQAHRLRRRTRNAAGAVLAAIERVRAVPIPPAQGSAA
ncbi:MAG TPA: hypothetical protein VHO01_08100 [Jatrophihabitans sp.]|nr:hypothetical protein [Jatrophihabitans sp.]